MESEVVILRGFVTANKHMVISSIVSMKILISAAFIVTSLLTKSP